MPSAHIEQASSARRVSQAAAEARHETSLHGRLQIAYVSNFDTAAAHRIPEKLQLGWSKGNPYDRLPMRGCLTNFAIFRDLIDDTPPAPHPF